MNVRIDSLKNKMKSSLVEKTSTSDKIDVYIKEDVFYSNLPEGLTPALITKLRIYEYDYKVAGALLIEELVTKALIEDNVNSVYARAVLEVGDYSQQKIVCDMDKENDKVTIIVEPIKEPFLILAETVLCRVIEDRIKNKMLLSNNLLP